MAEKPKPLSMKVSLVNIDDLGVKLYSGFPAALAELVANAWDADAERVDILTDEKKIVIKDDGHGMNRDDIQEKYLTIGYRRRSAGKEKTAKHRRKVMGRKGIGRLALFSMAKQIKVYSAKDEEKIGIKLSYPEIEKAIQEADEYEPEEIKPIDITCGTEIELTDFLYSPRGLQERLKERLSRRFSITGEKYNFEVFVNNEKISASDRNYFSKIQELWTFGNKKDDMEIKALCTELKDEDYKHGNDVDKRLSGWIGAVSHHGELKEGDENLNNIAIMMRGRLAQEDVLHSFGEGAVGAGYLVGEIHADYLDEDNRDIATSGRQRLKENDERYEEIKKEIQKLVKSICSELHEKRGKKEQKDIFSKYPKFKIWHGELPPDAKKITSRLIKDVAKIKDDDKDKQKERKQNLISCIIPAVEQMKMKGNLDALREVSLEDLGKFSELFNCQDDIEAMKYYDITRGRLSVIDKLDSDVQNDALEKIIQKHIYDHLWLLDPSWDPVSTEKHIEEEVFKKWGKVDKKLRLDIRYRKTSGQHVVIELKKPGKKLKESVLADQIYAYMQAVSKVLKKTDKNNIVEGIIILGELPIGWDNPDEREKGERSLQIRNIRVTTYQEIISQAKHQYKDYLEAQKEAKDKIKMIEDLMKLIKK